MNKFQKAQHISRLNVHTSSVGHKYLRRNLQGAASPTDRIQYFAELVDDGKSLPKDASLKEILKAVWANETVTSQFPDLIIRLTSLRGEVRFRFYNRFFQQRYFLLTLIRSAKEFGRTEGRIQMIFRF